MPSNQNKTFLLRLFMNRLLEEIMFVEVFILADVLTLTLETWQGFLEHRRFQLWFGAILAIIP